MLFSKNEDGYWSKIMQNKTISAYFFLAPALMAIFVFFFIPVIAAFIISFTDFDIYSLSNYGNARFVGFDNYLRLFYDPLFWTALQNTFYFVIVSAPLSIMVSLTAAIMLNSKLVKFKSLFSLFFFTRSTIFYLFKLWGK